MRMLQAAQPPHESQLDDVRVDEEEVSSLGPLRAGDGVMGTRGSIRENDIFEGTELLPLVHTGQVRREHLSLTRKKALAR